VKGGKAGSGKARSTGPRADAAFAALVVTLNRLAARKAAGEETAQPEIVALDAGQA